MQVVRLMPAGRLNGIGQLYELRAGQDQARPSPSGPIQLSRLVKKLSSSAALGRNPRNTAPQRPQRSRRRDYEYSSLWSLWPLWPL